MSKNLAKKEETEIISKEEQTVFEKITGNKGMKYARVGMAALSSIPWVGSFIGAAAALSSEKDQGDTAKVIYLWIREHEEKLKDFINTLNNIMERFDSFGDRISERIQSEEYLSLVRGTFWRWDHSETLEKREMLRKLITNAGGITVAEDDLVRMFLDWIEKYNELHFRVIAAIHQNPGITRRQIWEKIKGQVPKDCSSDADVFKLLMDDLTIGRVIRQPREIDEFGRFRKKKPQPKSSFTSDTMESPFNDDQEVLTELGEGFVKYVMNELNLQIGDDK